MTNVTAKVNVPSKWYHMIDNALTMGGRDAFKYLNNQRDYIKMKYGNCDMFRDKVDFNLEWQKGTDVTLTVSQRRGYKLVEIAFLTA